MEGMHPSGERRPRVQTNQELQANPEPQKTQESLSEFPEVERPTPGVQLDEEKYITRLKRPLSNSEYVFTPPVDRDDAEKQYINSGWNEVVTTLCNEVLSLFDKHLELEEISEAKKALIEVNVPEERHEEVFQKAVGKIYNIVFMTCAEGIKNSAMHGNKCDPNKFIDLVAGYSQNGNFVIWVKDEGDGYHPKDIPLMDEAENIPKATGMGMQTVLGLMFGMDNWQPIWESLSPRDWPSSPSPNNTGSMRIFDGGTGLEVRLGWQKAISEAYEKLRTS